MIIAHCLDGGIFDKMWYDAAGSGRKNGASVMDENESPPSLEMKHLSPSFVIWGIMLVMAALSFMMEMCSTVCLPQKLDGNRKRMQNKIGMIRRARTSRRFMGHTHCAIYLMTLLTIAAGQDIYKGCDTSKRCLGFEKGLDDVQTSCLKTQVLSNKIEIKLILSILAFVGLFHSCGIQTLRDEGLCKH